MHNKDRMTAELSAYSFYSDWVYNRYNSLSSNISGKPRSACFKTCCALITDGRGTVRQ